MAAAAVAAVAAVTAVLVGSAGAALRADGGPLSGRSESEDSWTEVLRHAWTASAQQRYTGEALWVVWDDEGPTVTLSHVERDRDRLTAMSADDHVTVDLGGGDGTVVDHRDGWLTPLLPADPGGSQEALRALQEKYTVGLVGEERLLDRPVQSLEVRRRADGELRERLWIDEGTGLVLRRESFAGDDRRLWLVAFLSLDLRPGAPGRTDTRAARGDGDDARGRDRTVTAVDDAALSALRSAGWTVPPKLPGGYDPAGVYAVDGADGQPLQVVYRDGLYSVSLFQQRGQPDWSSLPDGAQRADAVEWHAYEWPGTVPQRLVWEASGTTFSLVGDAPPDEFVAIAESLPHPRPPSLTDRLRRGLGRLWQWMTQ